MWYTILITSPQGPRRVFYTVKFLKKSYFASSLAFILLGLALLLWPETSLRVVCYLFGALILLKGVLSIWAYIRAEEHFFFSYFTLLFGVAASALGVFLLIRPDTVVSVLPILIGLFIVFDGVVRLQSAFDLRRVGYTAWWSFLLLALLSAALGVLMIWNPFATVQVLVMAIGIILLIEGALNLVSAVYAGMMLRALRQAAEEAAEALEALARPPESEPPAQREGEPPVMDVEFRPVDD